MRNGFKGSSAVDHVGPGRCLSTYCVHESSIKAAFLQKRPELASNERPENDSRSALIVEGLPLSFQRTWSARDLSASISSAEISGTLMGPARPPVPQTSL